METLEEPTLQDSLTKYCTSARGHTRIVNNPPKAGYYFFFNFESLPTDQERNNTLEPTI